MILFKVGGENSDGAYVDSWLWWEETVSESLWGDLGSLTGEEWPGRGGGGGGSTGSHCFLLAQSLKETSFQPQVDLSAVKTLRRRH